jgi:hypothetical protein
MPGVYGVTAAEIAAELPGIFPGGFSASTTPTAAQVDSMITTADTVISLAVRGSAGTTPALTDAAAGIAKRYVIESVKAQIIRIVYAGNDPERVRSAAQPYADSAKELKAAIESMGAQAVGTGAPEAVVQVPYTTAQRDLVIGTDDLDPTNGQGRRF